MSCLGERLKNERENHGWSQKYVADKLGLKGSSTYSNWEQGTREPDIEMLKKLSNIYDVSVEYLIGNTDIKSRNKERENKKSQLTEEIMSLSEEEQTLIRGMVKALMDKRGK